MLYHQVSSLVTTEAGRVNHTTIYTKCGGAAVGAIVVSKDVYILLEVNGQEHCTNNQFRTAKKSTSSALAWSFRSSHSFIMSLNRT